MNKVKFNVNSEYGYGRNFSVLQGMITPDTPERKPLCFARVLADLPDFFAKNNIDKPIPVEQLIKCKPQDNLEFLQWVYKFWYEKTSSYETNDYNGLARRRGASGAVGGGSGATSRTAGGRGTTPTVAAARIGAGAGARPASSAATAALQQENAKLRENVIGLERERDFYFGKLRDIELLIQQAVEEDPEIEKDEDGLIKHIQTILYSTEDGFEIPAEGEDGGEDGGEHLDDQETF